MHFSPEQLSILDRSRVPRHVAFIPDGNRRWAKKQQASATRGQRQGADILMDIIKACKELGIKVVTVYIFSTENWHREQEEVQAFIWLIESYLRDQRQTMIDNGIRMQSIGDLSRFPLSLCDSLQATKEATRHCKDIDMVFALNYGGRDEMRRAIQRILEDHSNQKFKREEVTETLISRYLDTAEWSDPDMLIRTSGELRFSNFLLWQISYTEVYFTDTLWPDFTPQHLFEAVINFQKRERRLGGA